MVFLTRVKNIQALRFPWSPVRGNEKTGKTRFSYLFALKLEKKESFTIYMNIVNVEK